MNEQESPKTIEYYKAQEQELKDIRKIMFELCKDDYCTGGDGYFPDMIKNKIEKLQSKEEKINKAIELIESYGWIDGAHHKQWVLDNIIRALVDDYDKWLEAYQLGEDGANTYGWDEGIAP